MFVKKILFVPKYQQYEQFVQDFKARTVSTTTWIIYKIAQVKRIDLM